MKNPRAVVCHWQIAFVTSKDLVAPLTRITKGDLSVEIDFDNFDSAVCGARTDFEFKRLAAAAVWHAGCHVPWSNGKQHVEDFCSRQPHSMRAGPRRPANRTVGRGIEDSMEESQGGTQRP